MRLALPEENLAGARRIVFEVRSEQDKVENDFTSQNVMLVFANGSAHYLQYEAPTSAWNAVVVRDHSAPGPAFGVAAGGEFRAGHVVEGGAAAHGKGHLGAVGFKKKPVKDGLMDGAAPPIAPVRVPPSGVAVRASTDRIVANDPLVARALALVEENLSLPWGVEQLAGELGVPSIRLHRHFVEELGRPPGEEIRRRRLARARLLLRGTDLPLGEIARQCGFCHAQHLSNLFRRDSGLSPRAWRVANRAFP